MITDENHVNPFVMCTHFIAEVTDLATRIPNRIGICLPKVNILGSQQHLVSRAIGRGGIEIP